MHVFGRTMTREQYKHNDGEYRRRENDDRDEENQRAGGMKPTNFVTLGKCSPRYRLAQLRKYANAFVPSRIFRDNKPVRLPKDRP